MELAFSFIKWIGLAALVIISLIYEIIGWKKLKKTMQNMPGHLEK